MSRSIVGDNQSLDEGFKFKDIREQKDAEDNLSDDSVDYKGTMHTQGSSKSKGRIGKGNTTNLGNKNAPIRRMESMVTSL